ncbi:acetyltransferase [Oceaniovalibus guishaninsula JLT2003]|uniref:Acetyltransferase n=1 Tax=Oceaniovalibus guishaninsula JLT2003 TaxID=1231392 RepID=K2GNW2_9RHOB|nr:GNAT family N-acetyltransferase [Oceaniovalibus guishaninsula]EKE44371.1 acetyltransferase [Oceaniovalibus guishaninsula JLT2003]
MIPPITTALRDGTPVLLRTVTPDDAPLVEQGFAQLSDSSRQFRFLRAMPRLGAEDLRFLTHPDHTSHEAIGAGVIEGSAIRPAGIARWLRLPPVAGDPPQAEFAITVIDAWQRRGLGSLLLGLLARDASGHGFRRFSALVHAGNAGMIGLIQGLGGTMLSAHGTEREYAFDIHTDPANYPDTRAGDVFRRAYGLTADAAAA